MLHVNLSHEKGCYGSETLTVVEGETWRPVQSTDALSWWVLIYLWSNTKKPKTFNASYLILIQWQACRPSHCYLVSIKKSRCSPYQDKLRRGLGFVWISCSITPTANTSPQVLNLRSWVVLQDISFCMLYGRRKWMKLLIVLLVLDSCSKLLKLKHFTSFF